MDQQLLLVALALVSIIILIVLVAEVGYIIYMMNSDASSVSSVYHKNKRHSRLEEHFNPERNYPQPPNSMLKESPVDLYYAAGNTETLNNDSQIRDDYYAKHVEHY